jgi:hypothetical protein
MNTDGLFDGLIRPTYPLFLNAKAQRTQSGYRRSDAFVPVIDGGTVADLKIADRRWEARQLRTQASVAAAFPTGRRASGASVPPFIRR